VSFESDAERLRTSSDPAVNGEIPRTSRDVDPLMKVLSVNTVEELLDSTLRQYRLIGSWSTPS